MEKEFIIKDSGERTTFPSGAVRDLRVNKGMSSLIPSEAWIRVAQITPNGFAGIPVSIWVQLAKHYEAGRIKYSDAGNMNLGNENWLKGIYISVYWDSAVRHLQKILLGWEDENHYAASIWNICGMMETERRIQAGILPIDLDNRDKNTFTTASTSVFPDSKSLLDCWNITMECLLRYKMGWNMVDYLAIAIRETAKMESWKNTDKDNRDKAQFTTPFEGA